MEIVAFVVIAVLGLATWGLYRLCERLGTRT